MFGLDCVAMYSKGIFGENNSKILLNVTKNTQKGSAAIAVFSLKDYDNFKKDDQNSLVICSKSMVNDRICSLDQIDKFIVNNNTFTSDYLNTKINWFLNFTTIDGLNQTSNDVTLSLNVTQDSVYCWVYEPNTAVDFYTSFDVTVTPVNYYGYLPATWYATLPVH